ncbi:phosphonate C-P lyase system protein PhnL [Paludibacterium paludis]|uniref:Phosphonate C-P lyase system protein PhnL n=1 Tax=Paludibacterium paludis TaxID=1225769 RepID=A0A918NY00_9NEIS|nr:phosphonate C-P lyase system protein PhnL [Paludibacterium paludis]GGY04045.1 phosphonate C-P lyase system protein PhnL [Paludibacterium paludis]
MTVLIEASHLAKTFVLHQQNALAIPVLGDVSLTVKGGECVALCGPSGAGKSTLLKALYGNYLVQEGRLGILHEGEWIDLARASPRTVIAVREKTIGYVSQFLRAIPRVPALDLVADPLLARGANLAEARLAAGSLLARLNIAERLWTLPPATFSGGEQQRVNIARGLIAPRPILLLDEPTASLDAGNRRVVVELIREARARGAALVGIFHDAETRDAVADRLFDVPVITASA